MNRPVSSFLRFLCIVDRRSTPEIRAILGCSRATVKRHVVQARELGCDLEYDWDELRYRMRDPGPFNIGRLRIAIARGSSRPALRRVA